MLDDQPPRRCGKTAAAARYRRFLHGCRQDYCCQRSVQASGGRRAGARSDADCSSPRHRRTSTRSAALVATIGTSAHANWTDWSANSGAQATSAATIIDTSGEWVFVVSTFPASGTDYYVLKARVPGHWNYDGYYKTAQYITTSEQGKIWAISGGYVYHRFSEYDWEQLNNYNNARCGGGTINIVHDGGSPLAVGKLGTTDLVYVIGSVAGGNGWPRHVYIFDSKGICWSELQATPNGGIPGGISVDHTQGYSMNPIVTAGNQIYRLVGGQYGTNWVQIPGNGFDISIWGNLQVVGESSGNWDPPALWNQSAGNWYPDPSWPGNWYSFGVGRVQSGGSLVGVTVGAIKNVSGMRVFANTAVIIH